MNVLYVVPPYPNRVSNYLMLPSLEVCIQAQILRSHGHNVSLLDMKIDNLSYEDALIHINNANPDVVIIDDEPKVHCNSVRLIKVIRKYLGKRIRIVIRGELPSFIPQTVLERNPDLDLICRFDDDYAISYVLNVGFAEEQLRNISNIAFRTSNGEIVVNPKKKCTYNLNSLPMPDRNLYDLKKYLKRDTETIVRSSRGCPGNCLFCIKTRYEGFRLFSVQRFCDEIEEMLSYGFTSFFFSDDTFAFSDQRLDDFYQEVKRRNLHFRWTSNIRITDINDFKLQRMKEIGAYRVFVGIETVNARTQKTINKNLTADMVREKTALLHKYDMEFHASFILGNPGDTPEDIESTISFVKEIKPTLVTFNLIRVYPGLDLYANPSKYGVVMDDPFWYEKDDWSTHAVMGTKQLPPEALEYWSRRCLREFILG